MPIPDSITIAQAYFNASNRSDLKAIAAMMTPATTYSSHTTGVYLGVEQIIEMQRAFHNTFRSLNWDISAVKEIRPGVIWFDFVLRGEKHSGETVEMPGEEYVVVQNGKLAHIDVRAKVIF